MLLGIFYITAPTIQRTNVVGGQGAANFRSLKAAWAKYGLLSDFEKSSGVLYLAVQSVLSYQPKPTGDYYLLYGRPKWVKKGGGVTGYTAYAAYFRRPPAKGSVLEVNYDLTGLMNDPKPNLPDTECTKSRIFDSETEYAAEKQKLDKDGYKVFASKVWSNKGTRIGNKFITGFIEKSLAGQPPYNYKILLTVVKTRYKVSPKWDVYDLRYDTRVEILSNYLKCPKEPPEEEPGNGEKTVSDSSNWLFYGGIAIVFILLVILLKR